MEEKSVTSRKIAVELGKKTLKSVVTSVKAAVGMGKIAVYSENVIFDLRVGKTGFRPRKCHVKVAVESEKWITSQQYEAIEPKNLLNIQTTSHPIAANQRYHLQCIGKELFTIVEM